MASSPTPMSAGQIPRKAAAILGTSESIPFKRPQDNGKDLLQAGLPYEQLTNSQSATQRGTAVPVKIATKPAEWRADGIFSSMAKQQRKNALIKLSSPSTDESGHATAVSITRMNKPKLRQASSVNTHMDWTVGIAKPAKETERRRSPTKTSKAPWQRKSMIGLPHVKTTRTSSDPSPVPSLVNDSEAPSSDTGSPMEKEPEAQQAPQHHTSRKQRTSSTLLASDLADRHHPDRNKERKPQEVKLQNWFDSIERAEEQGLYPASLQSQESIYSNYPGAASDQQSIELAALGFEFDVQSQGRSNFQAVMLPARTGPSGPFAPRGGAELQDWNRSTPSQNRLQPLTEAETVSYDRMRELILQGSSVLDLSETPDDAGEFDSEQSNGTDFKESHGFSALDCKANQGDELIHPAKRNDQEAVDSALVHPAKRGDSRPTDLEETGRNLSYTSQASTLRSPAGMEDNAKLEKGKLSKSMSPPLSAPPAYQRATGLPVDVPGSGGESDDGIPRRLMAVSEDEERFLASMRRKRASMQLRLYEEGYKHALQLELMQHISRPVRNEKEAKYSRAYSVQVASEMHELIRKNGINGLPTIASNTQRPNARKSSTATRNSVATMTHNHDKPIERVPPPTISRRNTSPEDNIREEQSTTPPQRSSTSKTSKSSKSSKPAKLKATKAYRDKPLPATPQLKAPPPSQASQSQASLALTTGNDEDETPAPPPPVPMKSPHRSNKGITSAPRNKAHITSAPRQLDRPRALTPSPNVSPVTSSFYANSVEYFPSPLQSPSGESYSARSLNMARSGRLVRTGEDLLAK